MIYSEEQPVHAGVHCSVTVVPLTPLAPVFLSKNITYFSILLLVIEFSGIYTFNLAEEILLD